MDERTTITPQPNGPYLVKHGHSLTDLRDGTAHSTDGTVALCRCGGSQNKPFCDGTHGRIGFTDAKHDARPADRRDDHAGPEITVHDNRGICAHAGRCTDGLPAVFKLGQEPWIDPAGDTGDRIAEVIRQCPSGALSYSRDGREHRDRDAPPAIGIAPNGPYVVKGGAELAGTTFGEGASQEHFTLCRCGQSTNKPFCSGAHWNHHFDEHAPKPEA